MKNSIFSVSKTALLIVSMFGLFTACDNDDDTVTPPLEIPTTYDGAGFTANTTTQREVNERMESLIEEAEKGRAGNTVTLDSITYWFTTGTPSVKSLTAATAVTQLEGSNGWFAKVINATGKTYTPGPATGSGGKYGNYLFDANGVDLTEIIEKTLFSALQYKHATELLAGNRTAATADQVVAIYGASPAFSNSYRSATNPDQFVANYATRRDKNDGNGLYSQMKNHLIKLQAAIKAGDAYKKDQDEAAAAIKATWEKIHAASAINYCHTVRNTMSATNPTDAQKASSLHALTEAIGFLAGWKAVPQPNRLITDAQLDEVLALFNMPSNGTPTPYKFITDPVTELPKLDQVIGKLKTIYGFTDTEILDFKENWVTKQPR